MAMMHLHQAVLSTALSIAFAAFAYAETEGELKGHPVVVDGDTLKIDGKSVHLFGIDAP
jgi:endonuclease YncB( thermonuclease family)